MIKTVKAGEEIFLGKTGENYATTIVFLVDKYFEDFGKHGQFQLLNRRPKDEISYPCVIKKKGNTVEWNITAAEVSQAGPGKCELQYYVNDHIVKSQTWDTFVIESIGSVGEMLEPYLSWVEEVLRAGANAQAAKAAIEALEVEAKTIPAGQLARVRKILKESNIKFLFEIPKGDSPVIGVDYYTEEDKRIIKKDSAQAALQAVTDHIEEKLEEAKTDLETSFLSFAVEEDGNLYMIKSSKLDVNFYLNEMGELIYEC